MAKSNKRQDSTVKANKSKKVTWDDTYYNHVEGETRVVTNTMLERVAADLVKWSMSDSAVCATKFYLYKGINPNTWKRWIEKSIILADAYDIAKEIIGVRREEGVMYGKLRDGMIMESHGTYSHLWREEQGRKAVEQEGKQNAIRVYVDKVEPQDIVPPLKIDKE